MDQVFELRLSEGDAVDLVLEAELAVQPERWNKTKRLAVVRLSQTGADMALKPFARTIIRIICTSIWKGDFHERFGPNPIMNLFSFAFDMAVLLPVMDKVKRAKAAFALHTDPTQPIYTEEVVG